MNAKPVKSHIHKLGEGARGALIMCIDYRFWPATIKHIKERYNPAMMDLETVLGGPEKLATNDSQASHVVLNELALSDIFHQLNEVFLVMHQDCEVYSGGSISFESLEAEEEQIIKDLNAASENIKSKFPNLKIIKLYAYFDVEDVKFREI